MGTRRSRDIVREKGEAVGSMVNGVQWTGEMSSLTCDGWADGIPICIFSKTPEVRRGDGGVSTAEVVDVEEEVVVVVVVTKW